MRIVAIAALHRSFENFVMEGQLELMFGFRVATHAKLRLARPQQPESSKTGFLRIRLADVGV